MSDLMQQFMQMSGGGAPPQPDVPNPLAPEAAGQVLPEDPQLTTGVIEIEPGLKVARSIAQKVIDIENKCGVQCVEGYRDQHVNKARSGTAQHSFHTMTEDGHGAADFSGSPRNLQRAMLHAKQLGAIESDIHNDGRGQLLHVAF